MSLQTYELDKLMQQYSISELRNIPEYVALCNAHAKGLSTVQNATSYLTDAMDVNNATGIWLDYLGWLVGINRSYSDITKFFSVNHSDINVQKLFWFAQQTINPNSSIKDELFRQRILAKIQYNKTRCTRNENIAIIKGMTLAQHVIIENVEPMSLNITLYGDEIIETPTMITDIESILGNGVGINRLQIRGLDEYEET